jgi:hypothetical protein
MFKNKRNYAWLIWALAAGFFFVSRELHQALWYRI